MPGTGTRLRRALPPILLSLLVTLFFIACSLDLVSWRPLRRLENFSYDTRVVLTMPGTRDDRIVIVDIDEKSLAEQGHWPWPRDRLARLVQRLFDKYDVLVVGFDVVFPESDRSSGLPVLEQLGAGPLADVPRYLQQLDRLRPQLNYDAVFAESMRGRAVLLGYYFTSAAGGGGARAGVLPPPVLHARDFADMQFYPPAAAGYGANVPVLYENAAGSGHFTPAFDEDGVVRRVPMLYEYQGGYYEALALAVLRNVFGVERLEADLVEGPERRTYTTPEYIRAGPLAIPIDEHSNVLVPYRGRRGSYPYVSATDVLNGRVPAARLRGSIVLVGASAQGTYDLRNTPVQTAFPGVEVHANIISGVLDHDVKRRPRFVAGAELLLLAGTGLAMALLLPQLSAVGAVLFTTTVLTAHGTLNLYLWQMRDLVLQLAPVILLILVIFLLNMSWGFFVERRGRRQLGVLFGQYVPPELVDEMSDDPTAYTLEAESRELTVLFSDVRGFTSISEALPPAELAHLMNEYLTLMTRVIHEHRGTIDKYMGDAIMAFWGAPMGDPEHARHALEAALAMQARLEDLREQFAARGWPRLHAGIGINTGIVSVGNMGSRFRMAYTVMGDAVNLASRLEGLTKVYGADLIVSTATRDLVPQYAWRELDVVRVKGRQDPVAIFEPVAKTGDLPRAGAEELARLGEALQRYRRRDWGGAARLFRELQDAAPGRELYGLYLRRIKGWQAQPPGPDWNGVHTFDSK